MQSTARVGENCVNRTDGFAFAFRSSERINADQSVRERQTMSEHFIANEIEAKAVSGWIALLFVCALLAFGGSFAFAGVVQRAPLAICSGLGLVAIGLFCARGFFTLQPNEAAVMVFFGTYAGTARQSGFYWVNPFHERRRISLRTDNLTTPILKVNDQRGNPIEIAAVLVWHVKDTARALFQVEDFTQYVRLQSEAALRELASQHAYDHDEELLVGGRVRTLRGDSARVAASLRMAIQAQVELAGIAVADARIAHLAYAPEIAQAMLRRQQAEAVLAARRRLVEGAVGMVELALFDISEKSLASFTQEQKVALVTNLMTVLVGDEKAQPVLQMAKAD
jgi:regulator of protease activity HflC (stomatin/prohibitin superfamily)